MSANAGNGDGIFGLSRQTSSQTAVSPTAVAVGDFDNDGLAAAVDAGSHEMVVFPNK